jgi:hypothetical protein
MHRVERRGKTCMQSGEENQNRIEEGTHNTRGEGGRGGHTQHLCKHQRRRRERRAHRRAPEDTQKEGEGARVNTQFPQSSRREGEPLHHPRAPTIARGKGDINMSGQVILLSIDSVAKVEFSISACLSKAIPYLTLLSLPS